MTKMNETEFPTPSPEGEAIKNIRLRQRLTQADLSRRAGVVISTISLFESGRQVANIATFRKLAAVLGPLAVQTELIAVLRRRGQDDTAALAAHAAVRAEQVRTVEGE